MDSTRIAAGFRFRLAKAIAVVVPLSAALYLAAYSLGRKEWRTNSRITVPEQVASLRASSADNPFIGNVQVDSATRRRCVESLAGKSALELIWEGDSAALDTALAARRVVGWTPPEGWDDRPPRSAALDSALAARHPDCPFTLDVHRPFVFSHSDAIITSLGAALAIALVFFGSLEIYRYPHAGWRRLALVIGAAAAVGIFAAQYFEYLWIPYGVLAVPAAGLLGAFSVVGAREISLWIREGFENSSRHDGEA